MPKVPNEELKKEGVKAEVAPSTRSIRSILNAAHRKTTAKIAAFGLAAALIGCAPATLNAQETTPAKGGRPEVAAVESGKKAVEYQTFSDPKELQPFFDAAKDKIVSIKPGETKQLGPYSVKIDTQSSNERGTDYEITADNGQDLGVTLCGTPDQITPLLIDMGENHPYMKGQMLAFANYVEVRLIYFDKKSNKYQKATVSLEEGKIRPVPTNVGLEMLKDGGFSIFTAPKRLLTGDVVGRADGNPDGSLGYLFFKFVGPSEPGLIAANK